MKTNKIIALLLAALMSVTLIPSWAFAEDGDGTQPEPCVHTMEYVEKVEATCQHSGMEAYWHCTTPGGCDGLYMDEEGQIPVEGEDLIIPMLDHQWEGEWERMPSPEEPGIYTYTCTVCGEKRSEEEEYIGDLDYDAAYKLKLDGYRLQFSKSYDKVVKEPQKFLAKARVDHVAVKGKKKKMTVSWNVTKDMKVADGVIILRKTGKEKTYKEIKRVPFYVNDNGYMDWSPKTSFTDKTAKKKNTPYSYIAIAYRNEDIYTFISHCSAWAAGQTSASKLKNAYTAAISKKSADLQYMGKVKLKLKIKNAKKYYNSKSFRWYSDNTSVAKVSSKGVVTATGKGSTVIRGRLSSGSEFACKVSVVNAFKPAAPKLRVDVASTNSITLVWNKVKYATSYDLYRSDDGLHWKDPVRVSGTSKKVTGLTKDHRYTFYVIARNDNHGFTALSKNSNVVNQKAVIKRRDTKVSGFPGSLTKKSGDTITLSLKITSPDGRKANLQMQSGTKWVTKKTVTLPKGAGTKAVKIVLPDKIWWCKTTHWRLYIPRSNTSESYTTGTLTLTGKRRYQNPSNMIQIKSSITSHGYGYYICKLLVNSASTRAQHIEALIKTANKYVGDKYVAGRAGAPGKGIDAAGLIMESCYGAGIDLWPISPYTRPSDCIKKIMTESKLQFVTDNQPDLSKTDYVGVYRGDLIFFNTGKGKVGHVAIYLGLGKILHASQVSGKVETTTLKALCSKSGKYKYKVAEVRRVFN